jgi:hypothetical protein
MLVLCLLLFVTAEAVASPQLNVIVGFSGRFVTDRITPIQITVSGVERPFRGAFRITQDIGNAWRGEATSATEFPVVRMESTTYTESLPLYDFAHPLVVSMTDDAGNTIAQETVDLRSGWSPTPLAVAVGGFSASLGASSTLVDATSLPTAWIGYEGVGSLWIGRLTTDLGQAQWEAICRWTHAGGATVVFTGSDVFLIDSPLVRDLIAIADPRVTADHTLAGDLRPGAVVIMRDDSGTPVIIQQRYGAGNAFTVTRNAYSLTQEQIRVLEQAVSPAVPARITREAQGMLNSMKVSRPGYPTAVALVVCVLLSLMVIVSRTRKSRRLPAYLVCASVVLSVYAGFYINDTKRIADIYRINTHLSVQGLLGYDIAAHGLVSIGSHPVTTSVSVDRTAMQEVPHELTGHNYDIDVVTNLAATVDIERGEDRLLSDGADSVIPVSFYESGDESIAIENGLEYPLEDGVFIHDGIAFDIGTITCGYATYTLSDGILPDEFLPDRREIASLYAVVAARYAVSQGTWLIGGAVSDLNRSAALHREKVRDVKLIVIAGER